MYVCVKISYGGTSYIYRAALIAVIGKVKDPIIATH